MGLIQIELHRLQKNLLGIIAACFYRPDALPVAWPAVSEHGGKLNALTAARENYRLALAVLNPQMTSERRDFSACLLPLIGCSREVRELNFLEVPLCS